ncbi:MAG: hypothetical protein AVDCRST_MAG45-1036 [uncultured Solirubrobacterales bacterium]|uniref:M23ase beta-sheet core domain-containing protein n=1 Tax=uncultured Solirubrobacterales bacterium TaxID=768556 RepID=A0A6J4SLI4_9ACTN|nr:MAG: hypothetical protein AVDCRST_MAG45-1036 [uncultured Solirubrobacterales bacterium]
MAALALSLAPAAQAAGDWPWPVEGEVLTTYRNGDDPYAPGQHRGIDVAGEVGTAVHSATAGKVRYAGSLGTSGRTVSIRTADGRFDTSYLHLSEIDVKRGDEVSAGDRIGAVGTSGQRSAEQPHLHFGVRVAGSDHDYRDPLELLASRPAEAPAASPEVPAPQTEASEGTPAEAAPAPGEAVPGEGTTPVSEAEPAEGAEAGDGAASDSGAEAPGTGDSTEGSEGAQGSTPAEEAEAPAGSEAADGPGTADGSSIPKEEAVDGGQTRVDEPAAPGHGAPEPRRGGEQGEVRPSVEVPVGSSTQVLVAGSPAKDSRPEAAPRAQPGPSAVRRRTLVRSRG